MGSHMGGEEKNPHLFFEEVYKKYQNRETKDANTREKWRAYKEENVEGNDASMELIKLLQEQDEKENREKISKQYKEEIAPTCQICLDIIEMSDLLPLDVCGHMFHPVCMREYLKSEIEARRFPLVCPNPECKKEISMLDMEDFLDPASRQKWAEYTFKKAVESNPKDYSFCPTPDCKYIFVWNLEQDGSHFICPMCKKQYCLNCRCIYHEGQTCKEYQINKSTSVEDKKFMDFIKGMKLKQCPKCKFWVEKSEGCNHMTCRCGKQFCYVCGGDYPICYCKLGRRPPPEKVANPLPISPSNPALRFPNH